MVGQHTRWTAKRNRPENDPKEVRKMIECGTVDLKRLAVRRRIENQWSRYETEKILNQNLWLERHNFECAKTQLGEVERVLEKETNKKRVTADHQIFREELAKRNKKKLEALQIMSRKRKKRLMLLFTGISMLLFSAILLIFRTTFQKRQVRFFEGSLEMQLSLTKQILMHGRIAHRHLVSLQDIQHRVWRLDALHLQTPGQ